ncbi:hypothetical protein QQY66_35555 [Streptomyces sp. DG2A-72]|uniref:hypothetical protein n=1 Tax=Streptomyces sp. DG2A-72 TaxID=3051386 RepID=UPI00265BC25E|nr:hypothetical protein [Streptomyces sp. DG2A-72]MDO0936772.1 hypothetical protein [Streptomyces sp. DG2A-72]
MSERKPYKTASSDEQRALIEPVITAWNVLGAGDRGRGAHGVRARERRRASHLRDKVAADSDRLEKALSTRGSRTR